MVVEENLVDRRPVVVDDMVVVVGRACAAVDTCVVVGSHPVADSHRAGSRLAVESRPGAGSHPWAGASCAFADSVETAVVAALAGSSFRRLFSTRIT